MIEARSAVWAGLEDDEQRSARRDELGSILTAEPTNQRPGRCHSVVHSQVVVRAVLATHDKQLQTLGGCPSASQKS